MTLALHVCLIKDREYDLVIPQSHIAEQPTPPSVAFAAKCDIQFNHFIKVIPKFVCVLWPNVLQEKKNNFIWKS